MFTGNFKLNNESNDIVLSNINYECWVVLYLYNSFIFKLFKEFLKTYYTLWTWDSNLIKYKKIKSIWQKMFIYLYYSAQI